MGIKVLSPGRPKCQHTQKGGKEAVGEAGVAADVEKSTDVREVKSVGKTPRKEDVLSWIK